MTENQIKKIVESTVLETIERCKREGVIKASDENVYREASDLLKEYYQSGEKDASVKYALQTLRFEPYFKIIELFYKNDETLENIADIMEVDISTIVRNKKKLCLKVMQALS